MHGIAQKIAAISYIFEIWKVQKLSLIIIYVHKFVPDISGNAGGKV
jgi:hypothetical protein